ncbi:hypothetical protein DFH07DRAFT_948382 [Mycena maculata]|uniref:Uncharacterized protein n=1 Tax=Mycena maculata TaxID=230809 RepID=A0AAD7KIB1_9AGAR|nr:hypothetical protein DFH07DRAFT_948382 [Mycena maculata]
MANKRAAPSTTPLVDSQGRTHRATSSSPHENLPAPMNPVTTDTSATLVAVTAATVDAPDTTTTVAPATSDATTTDVPATGANATVEFEEMDESLDTEEITMPDQLLVGTSAAADTDIEEFPPLGSPGPEVQSHAAKCKSGKGKKKESAPSIDNPDIVMLSGPPPATSRDYNDEADRNRAHACSLGLPTDVDAPGASSSCRPAAAAPSALDSPPKHQRANTAGRAIPLPGGGDVEHPPRRGPDYHTINGLPPHGAFTPVPCNGGFRRVEGLTSRVLYHNIPVAQQELWNDQEHPKLTAFISGGNNGCVQSACCIAQLIGDHFNMDPDEILVGPPRLAEGSRPDPRAWLIGGLPLEQAQALIDDEGGQTGSEPPKCTS